MTQIPLIEQAIAHADRVAVFTETENLSYNDLLHDSASIAAHLLDVADDLQESRVAYLIPGGADYIATQWGIWRAGAVAVPLSLSATEKELEYVLSDSDCCCVATIGEFESRVSALSERLGLTSLIVDQLQPRASQLPAVTTDRRALILYTSGTTSKPKGVVTTHGCITAQIQSLVQAWHWQPEDRIPLFLPLHHVHGIINIMSCALWSGAQLEPFAGFDTETILSRVAAGAYSVFMAVPTIYVKLIDALESIDEVERQDIVDGFGKMRLMISGSAALPASIHQRWTELTGQVLLERYGMTEIGMALSNPYDGERRAGAVGGPLPGVEVRLCSDEGIVVSEENAAGEIQVRGANVFQGYWNRAEATRQSFQDGWFRTGDIAVLQDGYYRIMGRSSVDIIKSGGYKLSALEIEAALLDHPSISGCAVVGVADEKWGEIVAVAVVLKAGQTLALDELQLWCRHRVSEYKVPRELLIVDELPRNAMGKVTKPDVLKLFAK